MTKKTVLITGSSRGIGRAAAIAFAAAGYHVYLNCRQSVDALKKVEAEILSAHGSCTLIPGDVGNPDEVRSIFETVRSTFGGPDVLINNAGVSYFGLLTDMSDEDWNTILNTNLSSVFYCCRQAIPYMVTRKNGRIINISSMWGTVGASCEAAYSATKSGIHGLTRALAKELAPSNIQVNAIACGAIDTVMNSRLNPDERMALEEEIPVGRFGTVEEVAQLLLSVASSPFYMTGQIIGIDGGII